MNLEDCLPPELRGPDTRITSISDGLSGAAVHRVDTASGAFVLKCPPEAADPARWHRALVTWRRAAAAGLTPALVHVDEERRAVVTPYVVDQSFAARYRDPLRHEQALVELGRTLRRVHALPLPPDEAGDDATDAPWTQLPAAWTAVITEGIAVPEYVRRAVEGLLAASPPDSGRALVLSHNDVHPKNLVHDGVRLYVMDWDVAAPNEPTYDLATIAVFMGMDGPTCRRLLAAYEAAAPDAPIQAPPDVPLPPRFLHEHRLIAALCGVGFLRFGFLSGYTAGARAAGSETLDTVPTLGDVRQRMQAGTLSLATGEGRWAFGLALVRQGVVALT